MNRGTVIKSFYYAYRGLKEMLINERNFKIHIFSSIVIITIGIILAFNYLEWLVVLVVIAMVLSAEIFNSAIEETCNLLKEKMNLKYEETTKIRDLSAGSVFLIAIIAIIIGLVIIINKLLIYI